jgi:hypothetical protein
MGLLGRRLLGANTIRRAEVAEQVTSFTAANDLAVRRALEAAGVEFIDENGGGPGVRLRKGQCGFENPSGENLGNEQKPGEASLGERA